MSIYIYYIKAKKVCCSCRTIETQSYEWQLHASPQSTPTNTCHSLITHTLSPSDKQLALSSRWTTAHGVNWIIDLITQNAYTASPGWDEPIELSMHNNTFEYMPGTYCMCPVGLYRLKCVCGGGSICNSHSSVCGLTLVIVLLAQSHSAVRWSGSINRGHLSYLITDTLP